MSEKTLRRLNAETAKEVCERFAVSVLAKHLLTSGSNPTAAEFLDQLLDRALYADAVDYLAHALTEREAVWWGCLCVRHALGSKLDEKEENALLLSGAWVVDQSGEYRVKARNAAQEAGADSAAGLLASAVAQTGSKDEPYAAARSVSSAVKLLAGREGDDADDRILRQSLVIGLGVADDQHSWEPKKTKRPR